MLACKDMIDNAVNSQSTMIVADLYQSSDVIHVVDKVLLPKSLWVDSVDAGQL